MLRNRIVRKLGLTIIALIFSILVPLGLALDYIFSNFYKHSMENNLEYLTVHYAEMIEAHGGMMTGMMDMMAEMSSVDLIIFDKNGQSVKASDNFDPPKLSSLTGQHRISLSEGSSVRFEATNQSGKRFLGMAYPVAGINGYKGAIMLFSSIDTVTQTLKNIRYLMLLAGIGAFLVAVGITNILSRRLSNPLLQMESAAQRMAQGDFDIRVKALTQDEIGSLARAINELAGELKRYRDTRSEFFANISHELRTPITYLEGYSKVIKDGMYDSEEEKNKYLAIIHEEAARLKHLVQDLFELSKMEEGKISFNMEWMDLSEAMKNSLRTMEPKIKGKALELQAEIEPNLPYVFGDGMRMEQIFINLLDNAIRYTEKGKITVAMFRDQYNVVAEITDTGSGIPEEEQPNIFERFYRVEKSRSREYGGSGLGLSIVKKLVEMQDGTIEVRSRAGAGATFSIRFPINDPER